MFFKQVLRPRPLLLWNRSSASVRGVRSLSCAPFKNSTANNVSWSRNYGISSNHTMLQMVKKCCYSTQSTIVTSAQFSPYLIKTEELLEQGISFVSKEEYKDALPVLQGAMSLLQKYNGDLNGKTASYVYLNLAYVHHHLNNPKDAEENYVRAIESLGALYGPKYRDIGVAALNFAELLVTLKRVEEGIKQVERCISILRSCHGNDSFLAAALSNYAGYLCAVERFEEARAPCSEALKIFIRELGRNNDFTRSCFTHMYHILQKLNLTDALSDLESDWESVDKSEARGLSTKEIGDISQNFLHTVKQAEAKASPPGPTKGDQLYKRQLSEFFGDWENRGLDLTDPALTPILEQEVGALENGIKLRMEFEEQLKEKREQIIQKRKDDIMVQPERTLKSEQRERAQEEWNIMENTPTIDSLLTEFKLPHYDFYLPPEPPAVNPYEEKYNIIMQKADELREMKAKKRKDKQERDKIRKEEQLKAAAAAAAKKKDAGKKSKKVKVE